MVERAPTDALRPYIDAYVDYRADGLPRSLHRGLPSPYLTLVASVGDPIEVVAQADPRQAPARYRCVVGGLQDRPALIAQEGASAGVHVRLTPAGAQAFLGVPAAEMWNLSFELSDVIGRDADELSDRLHAATTVAERCDAFDRVFTRRRALAEPDPTAARAWSMLAGGDSSRPVDVIAHALGCSRQHLARIFRRDYGTSPGHVRRLARFEQVRRLLDAGVPAAEAARRAGYADQPHMCRAFARLAGCAPGARGDIIVPSVQDTAG